MQKKVNTSVKSDAKRMRWLLSGHGYFMEENYLCGYIPCNKEERNYARIVIDKGIADQKTRNNKDGT